MMSTKSPFDSSLTHLLDARILTFRVGGGEGEFLTSDEIDGVEFEVRTEEYFQNSDHLVRILLKITANAFSLPEEESEEERIRYPGIGEFTIGFTFLIENFQELVQPPEDESSPAIVDGVMMSHLFAMAYSTARGMILVKTRGTVLEGGILPIMNPMDLMERGEDVHQE